MRWRSCSTIRTGRGDSVERYVFRPAILRSFGWRCWTCRARTGWTIAAGVARIEAMLAQGEDPALERQLGQEPALAPMPAAPAPTQAAADEAHALISEQGSSSKF
jgi:hypothetical protein